MRDNLIIDNYIKTSNSEKQSRDFRIQNDQGHNLINRYGRIIEEAGLDYDGLWFLLMDM
jgi:hypothetical protein